MRAVLVPSWSALRAAGPGALCPSWRPGSHTEEAEPTVLPSREDLWGFLVNCPGCGQMAGVHVAPQPGPVWEITGYPEAITLSPSVHCVGCCGWHGWLRDGEWVGVSC